MPDGRATDCGGQLTDEAMAEMEGRDVIEATLDHVANLRNIAGFLRLHGDTAFCNECMGAADEIERLRAIEARVKQRFGESSTATDWLLNG
jgi:hypothetical protein